MGADPRRQDLHRVRAARRRRQGLLAQIPYQSVPRDKVKLPKRQRSGGYREPADPYKLVDERY